MRLNEIGLPQGRKAKKTKRLGRGDATGQGQTAGRGHKGQKARAGGFHKLGFEGGQMPLSRRMPKRGFHSIHPKNYAIVNVGQLVKFPANTEVDAVALIGSGVSDRSAWGIKLLSNGDISHPLTIKVAKASKAAIKKVEAAGGKVEIVG